MKEEMNIKEIAEMLGVTAEGVWYMYRHGRNEFPQNRVKRGNKFYFKTADILAWCDKYPPHVRRRLAIQRQKNSRKGIKNDNTLTVLDAVADVRKQFIAGVFDCADKQKVYRIKRDAARKSTLQRNRVQVEGAAF